MSSPGPFSDQVLQVKPKEETSSPDPAAAGEPAPPFAPGIKGDATGTASKKKGGPQRKRARVHYAVRTDISPLIHLTQEQRAQPLVQFVEIVQGTTQAPIRKLVDEYMVTGHEFNFHCLGSLLKAAVFAATEILNIICERRNTKSYTEMEIIDQPTHPYYDCFLKLVCAKVKESLGSDSRGYHSIRSSLRDQWGVAMATNYATLTVHRHAST